MGSFGLVILLTIITYPGGLAPTVVASVQPSLVVCEQARTSFFEDMNSLAADAAPPVAPTFDAWCEMRLSGGYPA